MRGRAALPKKIGTALRCAAQLAPLERLEHQQLHDARQPDPVKREQHEADPRAAGRPAQPVGLGGPVLEPARGEHRGGAARRDVVGHREQRAVFERSNHASAGGVTPLVHLVLDSAGEYGNLSFTFEGELELVEYNSIRRARTVGPYVILHGTAVDG